MSDMRVSLADRALVNAVVHLAVHAGGDSQQRDGLVLFAGGHPYPGAFCNGMVRLDRTMPAEEAIARATTFFAPKHRGFVVWTRSEADDDLADYAQSHGWFERPPEAGMPLVVRDRDIENGGGQRVPEAITTTSQAERYLAVVAAAYGMEGAPPSLLQAIFFTPRSALADGAIAVLLEHEGREAAGAMAVIGDGVACALWAATAPWARGGGLGPVCMRAVTHAAFASGARLVFAQSSQMGLPHWRRLGFERIGTYRRFLARVAG